MIHFINGRIVRLRYTLDNIYPSSMQSHTPKKRISSHFLFVHDQRPRKHYEVPNRILRVESGIGRSLARTTGASKKRILPGGEFHLHGSRMLDHRRSSDAQQGDSIQLRICLIRNMRMQVTVKRRDVLIRPYIPLPI